MARTWIQSANVEIDDQTGALLVQPVGSPANVVVNAVATHLQFNASTQTISAANNNRRGLVIHNGASVDLFVKFGSDASSGDYTYKVLPGMHVELLALAYGGIITGWCASGDWVYVTELISA